MLNFSECFLILIRNKKHYTLLNTFYPKDSIYTEKEIEKSYKFAQKQMMDWYNHYYKDYGANLTLGVGKTEKDGSWTLRKVL